MKCLAYCPTIGSRSLAAFLHVLVKFLCYYGALAAIFSNILIMKKNLTFFELNKMIFMFTIYLNSTLNIYLDHIQCILKTDAW